LHVTADIAESGIGVHVQSGAGVHVQSGAGVIIASGLHVTADIAESGIGVHVQSGYGVIIVSGLYVTADITQPTVVITQATTNPMRIDDRSGGVIITSSECISVVVKTLSVNSGDIYVGGDAVEEAPYSGHGLLLEAGESVNVDIDNVGLVHACATVSGDRVTWIANN